MPIKRERYTGPAIVLHWLVAVLMVGNVLLIWVVGLLPEGAERPVINTHKSIGLTVLGLAILRLLWRFAHPAPPLPPGYPAWERRLAHAAHVCLYALIFALPISGWVHDSAWKLAPTHPLTLFGVVPWFRLSFITSLDPAAKEHVHSTWFAVHRVCAYLLYGLFVLHVAGALKHQFADREAELERMLPASRAPRPG